MRSTLKLAVLALSLAGCDHAEKQAAEAKALADKAAVEAKAVIDKAAAEAKAAEKQASEAATQAKEALAGSKATLLKSIDEGVEAMNRKLDFLKEKAAKLPAKVKPQAEAALAAFDTAKNTVLALKTQVEAATDPAAFAELGSKATTALADAQKALGDAETAIMKK